jgi:hypothetical protein
MRMMMRVLVVCEQFAGVESSEVLALRSGDQTAIYSQSGPNTDRYVVTPIQLSDNVQLIVAIAISFLLALIAGVVG